MDRLLSQAAPHDAFVIRPVRDLSPPAWARRLAGKNFVLLSERVENVLALTPDQFEQYTFEAYASICSRLAGSRLCHPVRFWNHVPFITDPADAERDNYMVFNAGCF